MATKKKREIEMTIFVAHINDIKLLEGVGMGARIYVGRGGSVRTALMDAAQQIPTFFPFRKGSKTKLTVTIERTK